MCAFYHHSVRSRFGRSRPWRRSYSLWTLEDAAVWIMLKQCWNWGLSTWCWWLQNLTQQINNMEKKRWRSCCHQICSHKDYKYMTLSAYKLSLCWFSNVACDSQADSPLLLCQSVLLHLRDWQVAGLFSLSFFLFLFSYHTLHTWVSPTIAVILITLAVLHHIGIIIHEVCLSGVHYPPRPVLNILPVHCYFYLIYIYI